MKSPTTVQVRAVAWHGSRAKCNACTLPGRIRQIDTTTTSGAWLCPRCASLVSPALVKLASAGSRIAAAEGRVRWAVLDPITVHEALASSDRPASVTALAEALMYWSKSKRGNA